MSNAEPFDHEQKLTKKQDECPYQEIIALYHEILPEFPKVTFWDDTSKRATYLRARWKIQPSLEKWKSFFKFVRQSDFLMGKIKTKDGYQHRGDLMWLIRKENFQKIMEHKYVNRY